MTPGAPAKMLDVVESHRLLFSGDTGISDRVLRLVELQQSAKEAVGEVAATPAPALPY